MAVKLSALTTESAPDSADIIGIADPTTGVMKKITVAALKTYMDTLSGATAPTVSSKTCETAAPNQVVVVFNQSMTAVTTAGWSAKKNGSAWSVSSVTGSGTTWTFTMGSSAAGGDTLVISYDSTTGATIGTSLELVSFTDSSVTNNVNLLEDLTFSTAHGLSVASLNWSGSDNSTYYQNWGVATKSIASGQDGYIRAKYTATDGENAIIGIDSDNTDERIKASGTTQPFDWAAGAYVYSGTIYYFEAAVNITSTGVSISVGDYWRINRAGSVWKVQKSSDGTSWTDAVTLAYTGTGQTYLKANIDTFTVGTTKLYQPKGYNVS
jgi:hypothetical protein